MPRPAPDTLQLDPAIAGPENATAERVPEMELAAAARLPYDERLARACERKRSHACVGIDPSPELLEKLIAGVGDLRDPMELAAAIERFSAVLVAACRDTAVAVKFQLAWFELAGHHGWLALERAVRFARRAGLIVVLDAKRGDVPHSATAYARALLDPAAPAGFGADAMTVNVSLGTDVLDAFVAEATRHNAQVYALVHTSNAGASGFQHHPIPDDRTYQGSGLETSGREPWWQVVGRAVEAAGAGAVVGATHPNVFEAARVVMPTAPLLIPGVGAQGGSVEDLAALAAPGAAPSLVASSRGVLPQVASSDAQLAEHVREASAELAAASWRVLGA